MKRTIPVAGLSAIVMYAGLLATAQGDVQPTNDLPNPYRAVEGYFKLPQGRTWGSTSAVEIDKDGRSIWVAERCGTNSCAGSNLPSILKFDPSGKLVKSFGAGLLLFPHGIFVDREGNVWVTDGQDNAPRAQGGGRAGALMVCRRKTATRSMADAMSCGWRTGG